MRRALLVLVAVVAVVAVPARATDRPTGWDGVNPFKCVLQQAGFDPTGPDPGADPYCVEFDKRRQNVNELGFVQFASLEPARVAAASSKCFYFQSDHWRGSVVQDDGSTKTYEWDGHYFFDKARGEGGVWVTNFNVNGQSGDPSQVPGLPPDIAEHFGNGTGGFVTRDDVEADPTCAERAKKEGDKIYVSGHAGGEAGTARPGCVSAGPVTSRRLGPVALGSTEGQVRSALGAPDDVLRGTLRYCATRGGRYAVGERGDRSGDLGRDDAARVVLLLTNDRGFSVRGVRPRARASVVRRAFPRARTVARVGTTRVVAVRRRSGVLVGVRRGRVRWLAVYDRRALRTRTGLQLIAARALAG